MIKRIAIPRSILFLWVAWALLLGGYQAYSLARFDLQRPDRVLSWTADETKSHSQDDKPYLMEPFLNAHISWDSEYYISIALAGYDDPLVRAIPSSFSWENPQIQPKSEQPDWISLNHAFFPGYPLAMRVLVFPLRLLGLNSIAAATLAGVLVSMLGTLGAMWALYDLGRDDLGENGGLRAAFYLLIFPAGMFLMQVYTEGLFLGLSFGALALARRKKWAWAALLAAYATWTRAGGALLLLPLAYYWWEQGGLERLTENFSWSEVGKLLLVAAPLPAYLLWNLSLGKPFHIVESQYFGRGLLLIFRSLNAWGHAFDSLWGPNPQTQAYYLVEFAAIALAGLACILMLRKHPPLALYSLVSIVFSLTSGAAQGMHRYVMAAPVIFLLFARWGEDKTFDRVWTFANVLLMGVFAVMFSFDFWAG